jgi:hypothetical protein
MIRILLAHVTLPFFRVPLCRLIWMPHYAIAFKDRQHDRQHVHRLCPFPSHFLHSVEANCKRIKVRYVRDKQSRILQTKQSGNKKENNVNHEHRPSKWIVAGFAIIALLIAGSAIQSSAWSQGYTMGLLTASADSAQLAPYLLYRTGQGSLMGGGFFGGVLKLGLLLLFAMGIFKLIGFAQWRKQGGPPPWMRHYGPPHSESASRPADGPVDEVSQTEPQAESQADKDAPQSPVPVNGT